MIASTVRGIRSEVPLNSRHRLDRGCVANCDHLFTIDKGLSGGRRGTLAYEDAGQLDDALRFALQLD
jgi:mRNA-degrading endonuclease toxin of MazEF toxin-antitoxin module